MVDWEWELESGGLAAIEETEEDVLGKEERNCGQDLAVFMTLWRILRHGY